MLKNDDEEFAIPSTKVASMDFVFDDEENDTVVANPQDLRDGGSEHERRS